MNSTTKKGLLGFGLTLTGSGARAMGEYTSADWLVAGLGVVLCAATALVRLLGVVGIMEPGVVDALFNIFFPVSVALLLYVATRFSAAVERKQRRGHEERLEALLTRIADGPTREQSRD